MKSNQSASYQIIPFGRVIHMLYNVRLQTHLHRETEKKVRPWFASADLSGRDT